MMMLHKAGEFGGLSLLRGGFKKEGYGGLVCVGGLQMRTGGGVWITAHTNTLLEHQ